MRWIPALLLAGLTAGAAAAQQMVLPPHPRLLLNDRDFAAAQVAAKIDPLRAALDRRITDAAGEYLHAKPLEHVLIGPRLLNQSRRAIQYIVTCAMAYRLTGDVRFADRARSDMLAVASFKDWNPSHFLDVAEMSFGVAVGYDWLYPVLSAGDRAAIRDALLTKALVFAPEAYRTSGKVDPRLFFVTARMNWNQVCNGGLLAAALAVGDDRPDLAKLVVDGVKRSLPLAMAAYEPDGAYPEGPGYWSYGTSYNVIILALLEGEFGSDFGLGDSSAFARTAYYRTAVIGPTGLAFNYADGDSGVEPTPAYAWLALRYHDEASRENSRRLLRLAIDQHDHDRLLALNVAWFPGLAPGERGEPPAAEDRAIGELPLAVHFRGGADIALFRTAWGDPRALFVGFKAGDNKTNHAHLDLGSFVLESDGVRWAVDLGPDDYDLPGYFGSERWGYFRLNNLSHNTLTPGGRLQDPKATAEITAFSGGPGAAFAVADLTQAYPGAARSMRRGVAMLGRSRVLVQDEITGALPGVPIRWAMMTASHVVISPDRRSAALTENGRQLRADLLDREGAMFETEPASPGDPRQKQNKGYTLLTFSITPSASGPDLRLAVELTPVGDGWQAWSPVPLADLSSWR